VGGDEERGRRASGSSKSRVVGDDRPKTGFASTPLQGLNRRTTTLKKVARGDGTRTALVIDTKV
jgi:hypothetical protein